jgi:hypothetical protein
MVITIGLMNNLKGDSFETMCVIIPLKLYVES